MINVADVWASGITGKNFTVANVDDGLGMTSDDLSPNFFSLKLDLEIITIMLDGPEIGTTIIVGGSLLGWGMMRRMKRRRRIGIEDDDDGSDKDEDD